MEDNNAHEKLKSTREKKRIISAIHSTEKKIEFLEKDIINTIGLNLKTSSNQHLSTIAYLIQQQQKQNQKQNKSQNIEILFNIPIETDDNFKLFDREECNKEILNERKNLFNKQNQIKQSVIKFKEQVHNNENSIRYLDDLKSSMETIESNIVLFKENQKNMYEDLLITEKRLLQELSIFQEHLNEWEEKKPNKEWLVGRNSYNYGLLLKRKNGSRSSSTFSFSSTPTSNINLTPVPSEVTLEAKSIIKYGYTEGKKKFESTSSLSSLQEELEEGEEVMVNEEEDSSLHENNDITRKNSNKKYMKSNDFIIDTEESENNITNNDFDSNTENSSSVRSSFMSPSLKSSFLSDVESFRNFYIRNHGRNGGWDELSHSMFERIWKKIGQSNPRFEQTCLDSIPGIDIASLNKHIQWYKTYLELLQKKKEAIENWRTENKRKRIENQKSINVNPSALELEMKNKMNMEKKKKEDEQRQKIKQKLKLWKEKKKLEEEKENLIANEEKKKEKELEDKKLLMKQKINKEKLKIYNERKKKHESEDVKDKVEQDQRPSKEKKKLDLKYFREKDKKYLNKKLQRKLKNQKEKSEKELRLEKIKSGRTIVVVNDPNRIFKPTQNFQNYVNALHTTDKSNGTFASMEHANAFFHPANEFQHRAIPLWRRGLS